MIVKSPKTGTAQNKGQVTVTQSVTETHYNLLQQTPTNLVKMRDLAFEAVNGPTLQGEAPRAEVPGFAGGVAKSATGVVEPAPGVTEPGPVSPSGPGSSPTLHVLRQVNLHDELEPVIVVFKRFLIVRS